MQQWNYFVLEVAMFSTIALLSWQQWTVEWFRWRKFRRSAILLCFLWFALDQFAVQAGVWSFPAEGTLPIRIVRLPIEEYLCFIGHTAITFMIVRLLELRWDDTKH
jgi:lycopene cyclase domain-containing protein